MTTNDVIINNILQVPVFFFFAHFFSASTPQHHGQILQQYIELSKYCYRPTSSASYESARRTCEASHIGDGSVPFFEYPMQVLSDGFLQVWKLLSLSAHLG